jgi:O-antigen/teichoic acid export membrane protein
MREHRLFKLSWVLTTFDRASIYAISGRLISALSGIAILVLMATVLSRPLQGYFVTFFSVATIQLLFDLGLSTVMINFVAHEWTLANREIGDTPISRYAGLAGLAKFAFRWYGVAALAMFFFFQPLGWYLFADAHNPHVWPAPWLALSLAVSMDLSLFGAWTILEGCNEVRSVYGYRAIRTAGLGLGTALGLCLGAGLWSVAVGYLVALPAALYFLLGKHRKFLAKLIKTPTVEGVVWHRELLPMQWQTWITALANYASVWAITPITLKILGPVDAGRVGLTWMAINAVSGIAFIVVIVKAPTFGSLVARRAYRELDRLALKCGGTSVLLSLLGCGFLGVAVFVINVLRLPYASRVLPLEPSIILLVTAVIGQTVAPQLTYLRAFKREPYPAIQIFFAVLVVASVVVGSRFYGMMGIALGYFGATVLFFVPVATYSTLHFRRLLTASTASR